MSDKPRKIVVHLAARTVLILSGAWLTMLFLGAAHSADARVPALGFDAAAYLIAAAYAVRVALADLSDPS